MPGSFDRSAKRTIRVDRGSGFVFLALPAPLVTAFIGLAMIQPAVPAWISAAVQAEFVGPDVGPDIRPTQLAQPGMAVTGTRKTQCRQAYLDPGVGPPLALDPATIHPRHTLHFRSRNS